MRVAIMVLAAVVMLLLLTDCAGPTKTAHLYRNINGGSIVNCPEELDPEPTEWEYLGTAELPEDDVLSQCELQ